LEGADFLGISPFCQYVETHFLEDGRMNPEIGLHKTVDHDAALEYYPDDLSLIVKGS
jgi:hypothetical protein